MSKKISLIDKGMMLSPPSPDGWTPQGAATPRFGWDPNYLEKYKQKFSPWKFAKNCSAILGYSRTHAISELSLQMAAHLFDVMEPHLHHIEKYSYIKNNFEFSYLWQKFQPPFYGAFMNNVTAFGLLQLYEAVKVEKYLLLAERLLMTSASVTSPIPLCSTHNSEFWLYEYVFRLSPEGQQTAKAINFLIEKEWYAARIYNGHIHALFGFMRFKEMFDSHEFDDAIFRALETMENHLPQQLYQDRFFSYCIEFPPRADYGQARAVHLADFLAQISGSNDLKKTAVRFNNVYNDKIKNREEDILKAERIASKEAYDTIKASIAARHSAE